jgi:copper chaperone CopZ
MHRAKFAVAGMTCGACAAATRIALERLDGVDEAGASYKDESAWVCYDPARITPAQMEHAIGTLGYRPTLVNGQQTASHTP